MRVMKYLEDDKRTREEIHSALMQRLSEPIGGRVIGHRELTKEEKEEARRFLEEVERKKRKR